MRLSIGISTLAAALSAFPASALALTPEVHDGASFFTPDAVSKANKVITDIKQEHGKDLLIETFLRVPAGKEDEATDADAAAKNRFFTDWAVQRARAEHVNGIYVLICKEPTYIKVAVGNQTHTIFPDEDRDHLGQILVDRFKTKEYDEGLLEGVHYVQSTLNGKHPETQVPGQTAGQTPGQTSGQEGSDRWSPYGGGRRAGTVTGGALPWGLGGCLCVGLVVLGVVGAGAMALSALFRSFHRGPGGYVPGQGGSGYGPGGGYGGQGGGFLSSVLGGLFGGAAGSWAYDRFFGGHSSPTQGPWQAPNAAPPAGTTPEDTSYAAGGGGDFGGGDTGGAGDFGAGDAGSGDVGGGDFGGGDAGGNDSGGAF